jgi:hypothetical protein
MVMDFNNANIMASIVEDYIYKVKGKTVKINRACLVDQRQYLLLCQAYQIAIKDNNEK